MKNNKFCNMISVSKPGEGDGGNTGSWRVNRPVIDTSKCIPAKSNKMACFQCWVYCPDGVVTKTIPPAINYQFCKGCGICAEECPAGAISMVPEADIMDQEKKE